MESKKGRIKLLAEEEEAVAAEAAATALVEVEAVPSAEEVVDAVEVAVPLIGVGEAILLEVVDHHLE